MAGFKATRIKIEGLTIDLDTPIEDKVFYETTRRLNHEKAVQRLVSSGNLQVEKERQRQKIREDALIRALKRIGGVFIP